MYMYLFSELCYFLFLLSSLIVKSSLCFFKSICCSHQPGFYFIASRFFCSQLHNKNSNSVLNITYISGKLTSCSRSFTLNSASCTKALSIKPSRVASITIKIEKISKLNQNCHDTCTCCVSYPLIPNTILYTNKHMYMCVKLLQISISQTLGYKNRHFYN